MIPFLAASNGGTPVPVVSSAMYQVNPAAPSAGGYDGYNANAQLKWQLITFLNSYNYDISAVKNIYWDVASWLCQIKSKTTHLSLKVHIVTDLSLK